MLTNSPWKSAEVELGSPEFEFLIACCRGQRIAVDEDDLNWEKFLGLAERHRVVPQVYAQLAKCLGQIPEACATKLHRAYQENARKALWFTNELLGILKHLADNGIRAVPYKGPALAQLLYGDVTARQFSDLDILVDPQDVVSARVALGTLGYRPTIELSAPEERAYVDSGYEYSCDGPAGPHLLELQWRILPKFYAIELEAAELFARAHSTQIGGECVQSLHADDLLLVLCVHAAKHVWGQLSWICDIGRLAQSPEIDWKEVWNRARVLGIRRIVALSLVLARDLTGLEMPLCAVEWMGQDEEMDSLLREILRGLHSHWNTEAVAYFQLMMRLRERWSDRAKFVSRLTATPSVSEWKSVRLPETLFPLYRGVRVARLMRRAVSM